MASQFWSSADLKAIAFGGLINEDVMQQVFDISRIPLPLQDRVSSDGHDNEFTEWTEDVLAQPDVANARVDGSDSTDNDAVGGERVGNHSQISTKDVQVTSRARESDTIGRADELSWQVMRRQQELRRDVDAIALENQASLPDDGNAQAGLSGGLPSWITTTTDRGATGADGGFNFGTGIVDAPTEGEARGLTETLVRDAAQGVYEQGGNPSILMSVPGVIRKFSEYTFTSSARIATLQQDQGVQAQTAVGTTTVFMSDFGVTLELVSNRLQQTYDSADVGPIQVANVFIMDPGMLRISFLAGYRVDPLAKTGLADKRLMRVDWTLKVLNERAQGLIADINPATDVTL